MCEDGDGRSCDTGGVCAMEVGGSSAVGGSVDAFDCIVGDDLDQWDDSDDELDGVTADTGPSSDVGTIASVYNTNQHSVRSVAQPTIPG